MKKQFLTSAMVLLLLLSVNTKLTSTSKGYTGLETELIELRIKIDQLNTFDQFKMTKYFDEQARLKAYQVCERFNIKIEDLLLLFRIESGGNPKARNPLSNAVGLIQWLPKTAVGFGTTTRELYNMSTTEQLEHVEKYLEYYEPEEGYQDFIDIYLAVFHPAALGKSNNYIIGKQGSKAVVQNQFVDKNKDGVLTVADVKNFIS
jgi:hypothetical protein